MVPLLLSAVSFAFPSARHQPPMPDGAGVQTAAYAPAFTVKRRAAAKPFSRADVLRRAFILVPFAQLIRRFPYHFQQGSSQTIPLSSDLQLVASRGFIGAIEILPHLDAS